MLETSQSSPSLSKQSDWYRFRHSIDKLFYCLFPTRLAQMSLATCSSNFLRSSSSKCGGLKSIKSLLNTFAGSRSKAATATQCDSYLHVTWSSFTFITPPTSAQTTHHFQTGSAQSERFQLYTACCSG